jgi:hypothetical protein
MVKPALLAKPRKKRRPVGPYSRINTLTEVDGRCKVARCMRDFARALEEHLGGNPSPAQKVLIREASIKDAKLSMLVGRILTDNEPDLGPGDADIPSVGEQSAPGS